MNENDYLEIEGQIGYTFQNKGLLEQAFVRRSYSQEHNVENNEVLEFYGDKVLEFIVGKLFSEWYGSVREKSDKRISPSGAMPMYTWRSPTGQNGEYCSDYNEGKLTELRKLLVSRQTLAQRIYDMDLEPYLLLGKSDENNGARDKDSVREDLFEAILGAVAIDSGWDLKKMQDVVEVMLCPKDLLFDDNHVHDVVQWTIDEYGCVPSTCFNSYFSPLQCLVDPSINSRGLCVCHLTLGNYHKEFVSTGNKCAEARDNVYRFAYQYLKENGLLHSIKDEIDEPDEQLAINQLEILARRDYFELPEYKYTETHDKNGNPIWQVTCMIDDVDKVFNATDSSKKKAKKKAALKMLNYVLEYFDEEH